ncbi:MAG: polysaccharide export protein [Acidobacteriota bacterium]|nr:polysaccharide export protein [Acidobacteriota bacterium]
MRHPKMGWVIGFAACGIVLAASGARAQDAAQPTGRYISEYRIGPRDGLEIKVANSELINGQVKVTEQGTITLPFLGEISVEGLTAAELERKLAKALIDKQMLLDPQVTVTITDRQSKRVTVVGAVQTPGSYELAGRQTLLSILSTAGGLSRDAGREILVIRRLPDGTSSSLRIPADDLVVKGDTQYDIPLEAGDIINVQADRAGVIYILGEVKTPGALAVLQSRIPAVAQAIAQAGGWTERAALRRVVIKRRDAAGNEKEIPVDVKAILRNKAKDVPLQDGDTVYVPKGLI